MSEPLYPSKRGPVLANRSRAAKSRSWLQLGDVILRSEPFLSGCWKWASARGATPTTLDVAWTMTPFGTTTNYTFTGGSPELVACLQETMPAVSLRETSSRSTRMRTKIDFVLADQMPWPKPPRRPPIEKPKPRMKRCVPVLDGVEPDIVTSPIVYTVDDSDDSRTVQLKNVPTVKIGCVSVGNIHTDKDSVNIAMSSNIGAYQTCYADALERDPKLAGSIGVEVVFVDAATPSNITITGTADETFRTCLHAAVADVWLPEAAPEANIVATFTYDLVPASSVVPMSTTATYVTELRSARTEKARCAARAGILKTIVADAPWLDDARVLAVTKDFATYVAKLPDDSFFECTSIVDRELRLVAYGGRSMGEHQLRWSWGDRTAAVMPLANRIGWGDQLRWFHASTLATSGNPDGLTQLRALAIGASEPRFREMAAGELTRFEQPRFVDKNPCRQ
jgi:hypothetical protein